MAKDYNKIITDNQEEIKSMLLLGATQTEVHKKLGIGKTTWFRLAKENKCLIELLRQVEQDKEIKAKENITEALDNWANKPTYESLMEKAVDTVLNAEELSYKAIIAIARELYPQNNHYLQVKVEENRIKRELMEIEKRKLDEGITDTNITIINDTIKR